MLFSALPLIYKLPNNVIHTVVVLNKLLVVPPHVCMLHCQLAVVYKLIYQPVYFTYKNVQSLIYTL